MSTGTIEQVQALIKSTISKVEARDRVPTSEELSAIAKLVNSLNKLEETLRQPIIKPSKPGFKKMSKKQQDEYGSWISIRAASMKIMNRSIPNLAR